MLVVEGRTKVTNSSSQDEKKHKGNIDTHMDLALCILDYHPWVSEDSPKTRSCGGEG